MIYVDDILIIRNDPVNIAITKIFLHSHFHLKDLGDLKYFLGIEISASKNGIFISQHKYALEIIEDEGLLGTTLIDTPMEQGLKFFNKSDLLKDQGGYRILVGRLIYLNVSIKTRGKYNFFKKGKTVILVENRKVSRSQMTKWNSPLNSSFEI